MSERDRDGLWYAVNVGTFSDSDGDGVGDFRGLIDRLDHLDRLGVSTVWLHPFYPSPRRDGGYDVMDYYGVDDRFGTLDDFVRFVHAADDRGMDVVVDLVVNHTSDRHPWFRAARADPDSEYRDYYVWRDEPPPADETPENVFPGEVEGDRVWTYDDEAGAYYYHRFYPFQPDLNLDNPAVREEIRRIMAFWLELGVAGFRVDAATLMIQRKDPDAPPPDDPHELLRDLKRTARAHREDAVLLAEADDDPTELAAYVGDDEMDYLLNFVLNAHLAHALAVERAAPVVAGLRRLPEIPESGRWANFLRNHDELNLGRLAPADRWEAFGRLAPEEGMCIYGRGVRRRLAPMLGGDPSRIAMAFSLLFSMPGVPIVVYGDEIGMGEDLSLPGRLAVRTPMQWSDARNAGFSTAPAEDLVRPVIDEGPFDYRRVNVAAQRADPDSLLHRVERLHAARRSSGVGGRRYDVIETAPESVLAMRYPDEDGTVVVVHNLDGEPRTLDLDLGVAGAESVNRLAGDAAVEAADGLRLSLDGYGYGWFRVEESG